MKPGSYPASTDTASAAHAAACAGLAETYVPEHTYSRAGFLRTRDDLDLSQSSDQELISRARAGRENAYRELLSRYQRPVFSLVYRMVRDRELAEEISQEAFVRAFEQLHRYDPHYRFSSWIFKIAHNLVIDHSRKKRIDTVSLDGSMHATTVAEAESTRISLLSTDPLPDQLLEAKELGATIERAIANLRSEYRSAVVLRHVEDRSYEEIAAIMDLPLGTIKTYLHRARAELRESLRQVRADG